MSTFETCTPLLVTVIRPGKEGGADETVKFRRDISTVSSISNLSNLDLVIRLGGGTRKTSGGAFRVMTDAGIFWYDYAMTGMRVSGQGNTAAQLDVFNIIKAHGDVYAGQCRVTLDSVSETCGTACVVVRLVYSEQEVWGRYVDLYLTGRRTVAEDPDARLGAVRLHPRLVEMLGPVLQSQ
jgi:hypothetical protein